MSEPESTADRVDSPLDGLRHWSIHDERIDFRSEAYAVRTTHGWIAIDPLPLTPKGLDALGPVAAVLLTGAFHQRAAWSFRRRFGLPVWIPAGARRLVEAADRVYEEGPLLGGLTAYASWGPSNPHAVLAADLPYGRRALFCGDLLVREGEGRFRLVEETYLQDARRTRESVRRLRDLEADLLCPAHGAPAPGPLARYVDEALGSEN